jgi:hypothetical protein
VAELCEDYAHDPLWIGAGKERPFVVRPVVTFEEGRAVHFAEVEDGVFVAGAGALVARGHGERAAADVEDGLFDGFADRPLEGDGVFQHAEGHLVVVVDLQFQLPVDAAGTAGEEVDAEIADLGEFDVGPFNDLAEEEAGEDAVGAAEEGLAGGVDLLRHSTGRRGRGREGKSLGELAQDGGEGELGLVRLEPAAEDLRGGVVDFCEEPRGESGAGTGREDRLEGGGDGFLMAFPVARFPTFAQPFEPTERFS